MKKIILLLIVTIICIYADCYMVKKFDHNLWWFTPTVIIDALTAIFSLAGALVELGL
jgi:uncharacterized protein YxeA